MNYKTNLSVTGVLSLTLFAYMQTPARRELPTKKTSKLVKIDGLLNDDAWKDGVYDFKNVVEEQYFKNLGDTFQADQNNNISAKIIYFLNYLQLKKKKK